MGTGSGGSGGSGGRGGSGGGGGWGGGSGRSGRGRGGTGSSAGLGGYRFEADNAGVRRIVGVDCQPGAVHAGMQQTLQKIPSVYLRKQFGSHVLREIYRGLCDLPRKAGGTDPCAALAAEYGIDPGPGFLMHWVDALMDRYGVEEPNVKMRATARMAAEDFLISALQDNPDRYVFGSCPEVLPELDPRVFQDSARSFLSHLIVHILEREFERQPQTVQEQLREESRQLAARIVAAAEERFQEQAAAGPGGFLDLIHQNLDWFVDLLRQETKGD